VIDRTKETITPKERCTPEHSRQSKIPLLTDAQEAIFPFYLIYYFNSLIDKTIQMDYKNLQIIYSKLKMMFYFIVLLPQSIHCPFPGSLRML
jgi:hypothetical protein